MPTEVLLFLLGSVFTIGFIFYMYFSTRHKERLAAIDKGGDIEFPRNRSNKNAALKWGLILLFLGVALGIGLALDVRADHDGPLYTFPLVLVGGGIGQLIFYKLQGNSEDTV